MDIHFLYLVCFSSCLIYISLQQECDPSSESSPCSSGEICLNSTRSIYRCQKAHECNTWADCSGTLGTTCVSDYCQPTTCTATGQCVYEQVCSQDTQRTCVYGVSLLVREKSKYVLKFEEPSTTGEYDEIRWYKGSTAGSNWIVLYYSFINEGEPVYTGDYCSGSSSPCNHSDKVILDASTGELKIYQVELSDQDYYYYKFYSAGDGDTGWKYEYYMEVYVAPDKDDLILEGVSDDMVETGTSLSLTCTVQRIKPEAEDFYWVVNGTRKNGTFTSTDKANGTSSQTIELLYTVNKTDDGTQICCVLNHVYAEEVVAHQVVNVGYKPLGRPDIQPDKVEKYAGDIANLTCTNPNDDGNPNCNSYIWFKSGRNVAYEKSFIFTMNDDNIGNYTCTCGNKYGTSMLSNVVQVTMVTSQETDPDIGLIVGLTVAGLVLAIGVGAVILIVRRYDIYLSFERKKKPTPSKTNQPSQEKDDEIYQIYHEVKLPEDETPTELYEEIRKGDMIKT